MRVDIRGKVHKIEDEITFGSGTTKRTVIIADDVKTYAVNFWNAKTLHPSIAIGSAVSVPCYLESKEHNGRYYTSLNAL
jgi:hypothetical protein